jgi:NADPH:quinone reductase-like Zn-dependent oxidoreductase
MTRATPSLPSTMSAARLLTDTGPAGISLDRVDVPRPAPGEAVVAVHAAALTRDELTWPVDRLPAVPSYELAGQVAAVGAGVDADLVGAAVVALTPFDRDGVAADFAAVPAGLLAPRPQGVDDVHAAAIPLPGLSAWQALFDHGGLDKGDLDKGQRVLVLGAAGGVGQFVVQLAALHGAHVVAAASAASHDLAVELGATEVLDPSGDALASLAPVDLVVDTVGGDVVARAAACIRPGGRLVSVAGEPPNPADDSVTRVYFVVEPRAEQLAELVRLAAAGQLRVGVDATFPLADARAAFERVQQPGKRGKVVLVVRDA